MAKINLLKKKWNSNRQLKNLELMAKVIMFVVVVGLSLQTFYVAGRLVYLRVGISNTTKKIDELKASLEKNRTVVENYVWAQGVLENIGKEKAAEYQYKKYLLEINSWFTPGTSLIGVDFTADNEISFSVFADDVDAYRRFEANLNLVQKQEDFGYDVVEQESLSRTEDGNYRVRIRLTIKS